jgi:DNA-binding PadR family transcriptional regulator
LRPAILLLLRERESYGCELGGRLTELGLKMPPTSGALYKSLQTMAEEGLVTAYWDSPRCGTPRRVYAITEVGEEHLVQSMPSLAGFLRTVRDMLNRYRRGG